MTLFHYLIFLSCLLAFNVSLLYGYFLYCEMKEFEQIRNSSYTPTLPKAYPIFVFCFLAGAGALFYFTPEKTWFFESKFLYFLGLSVIFAVLELIPGDKKLYQILKLLLELSGILVFIFIVPHSILFSKTDLPEELVRIGLGVIWFLTFKFLLLLNRFENLVATQTFHIGFSSLIILVLTPFSFISLLEINSLLFFLIFMLTPFYFILQYQLPLKGVCAAVLCFILTGLSTLMALTGNWGIALLMTSYLWFELLVIIYRFFKNLVSRTKMPLFFFETLLESGASGERIMKLILRYHLLMSGLIFFIAYTEVQIQSVFLAILLYLKLYFNISNPQTTKSSLKEMYKQAKKDAKNEIISTSRTIAELKEKYQIKKENKRNEQP